MKNKTGADMWHFDLDVAGEHVNYQIFSKNYTFSKLLHIKNAGPLKLSFQTQREGGEPKSIDIDFTAEPKQNGGRLDVVFLPDGKVETKVVLVRSFSWDKETSISKHTVPAARKFYDALEPGMSADDVELITGTKPADRPTWSYHKGFGIMGMKETVVLKIHMMDGKVVRLSMSFPNDPDMKDTFIAEKGTPADSWNK